MTMCSDVARLTAELGLPIVEVSVESTAEGAVNEQAPLPNGVAAWAESRCVARTVELLIHRRHHLSRKHVGMRLRFADGTLARVYRETVVDSEPADPCILLVEFRLRLVRGWGHTI